jgi:hypothetical protein
VGTSTHPVGEMVLDDFNQSKTPSTQYLVLRNTFLDYISRTEFLKIDKNTSPKYNL